MGKLLNEVYDFIFTPTASLSVLSVHFYSTLHFILYVIYILQVYMLIFYIYIFSTTLHPLTNYIIYSLNIFKVYCLSSLESEGFFFFQTNISQTLRILLCI